MSVICTKCQQPCAKDDGSRHFNPMHKECWIETLREWWREGNASTKAQIERMIARIEDNER